ncbi:MAG: peptidoglycan DD-metalloendopeptidase family protein [Patescibacteria group bacterium]|jgi:murein DD-endopeptidase MepM/ murein hydrolase activator NlpD
MLEPESSPLTKFIKQYRKIIIAGGLLLGIIAVFYLFSSLFSPSLDLSDELSVTETEELVPSERIEKLMIESGDTYGVAMARSDLSQADIRQIYQAALEVYDLAKIKAGYNLEFVYDYQTNEIQEFRYQLNSEEQLRVSKEGDTWLAELEPIPYETKIVTKGGVITSSLYETALEEGIDERAIIALADAFQWAIDFAMDPRVDDTFRFVYEERYLAGEYVRPGKVLAGRYINKGVEHSVYYFAGEVGNEGYFDSAGNSAQKMFLKAPVAFKYISSGFTTGMRYVQAFNVATEHRAIDYAAPLGTPIRSVGDGTVSFAGWDGPYGNKISIRHNGTYSTNYAHLSKIAVSRGQKLKQGDIIGYVGSTGFSTGPHLHYEMVKNGVKINPLLEVLPPGEPLRSENLAEFLAEVNHWEALLAS